MNIRKKESGQTVVEYILLMALMTLIALAITDQLKGKFQDLAKGLASRVAQPCADCREIK